MKQVTPAKICGNFARRKINNSVATASFADAAKIYQLLVVVLKKFEDCDF